MKSYINIYLNFLMKKNPIFKLGKRFIGQDFKPLIIPEMGINHGAPLK